MTKVKQYILIVVGTFFVIIGAIGLLIPVFPTSPFLIIAGLCYIRSSKRLYNWLIKIKYFGPQVESYVERREISKKSKIYSLLFVWIPSLITTTFGTFVFKWEWYIALFPIVFSGLITAHILSLKTVEVIKDEKKLSN